jgi:hypothetical protein
VTLSDIPVGTHVEIGSSRYEVVAHGPLGTRLRKLVPLKSGRWAMRGSPVVVSSNCTATVVQEPPGK